MKENGRKKENYGRGFKFARKVRARVISRVDLHSLAPYLVAEPPPPSQLLLPPPPSSRSRSKAATKTFSFVVVVVLLAVAIAASDFFMREEMVKIKRGVRAPEFRKGTCNPSCVPVVNVRQVHGVRTDTLRCFGVLSVSLCSLTRAPQGEAHIAPADLFYFCLIMGSPRSSMHPYRW